MLRISLIIGLLAIAVSASAQPNPVNLQAHPAFYLPPGAIANDVAIVNNDNDPRPDLIVPAQGLNQLLLYIQPRLHNFGWLTVGPSQMPLSIVAMNMGTTPNPLAPTDFVVLNANGAITPWRRNSQLYYNAGAAVQMIPNAPAAPTDRLVSGNYELGGGPDLACYTNGGRVPAIARVINQGNGVFQAATALVATAADSVRVMATADVYPELSYLDDAILPRRSDPAGSFALIRHDGVPSRGYWWVPSQAAVFPLGSPGAAVSAAGADINADGICDVVVAAATAAVTGAGTGTVYVRLQDPVSYLFTVPVQSYTVLAVPREVRLADLNGDRRPELLVLGDNGTLSVFTNVSSGGVDMFDPNSLVLPTGPDPAIMRIADADGDGDLDVVIPCRGDATLRFFWNTTQVLSTAQAAFASELSIYPNPAQTVLHLDWKGPSPKSRATLLDLAGRAVRQWDALAADLAVNDLPRGLYLLRIENAAGQRVTRRIELR